MVVLKNVMEDAISHGHLCSRPGLCGPAWAVAPSVKIQLELSEHYFLAQTHIFWLEDSQNRTEKFVSKKLCFHKKLSLWLSVFLIFDDILKHSDWGPLAGKMCRRNRRKYHDEGESALGEGKGWGCASILALSWGIQKYGSWILEWLDKSTRMAGFKLLI